MASGSSQCQKQPTSGTKRASRDFKQRMFIIRHGERLDNVDWTWARTTERPYDPPLTEDGEEEASSAGQERFRGKDVHYIISSPFLRCLQTAQQLSNALSLPGVDTCNGIVDVLNGHCGIHQQPEVPASDVAQYGIKIMNQDESELPKYPERTREGLQRFLPAFNDLADQHWPHNIVVVTHGYGVSQSLRLSPEERHRSRAVWVDYCGHVEFSRESKECHTWRIEQHKDIFFSS